MTFAPAAQPTMYFLGVTTGKSSINKVFPLWTQALGLGQCQLVGLDFKVHDDPARYRAAVEFIKSDPLSLGGLVTTHKMDLYSACRGLFDALDPFSDSLGEVSSLYKRSGRLHARTVDPLTSGLALEAFLPAGHWQNTGAEALILGAGGSAVALAWHLVQARQGTNRPAAIHVANRSQPRLDHLRQIYAPWTSEVPLLTYLVPRPEAADAILDKLPPGSLVVNATGLGKDAPGSPLSPAAQLPVNGYAWEYNYRGDLLFLQQARAQAAARGLHVEDGWIYFLHGWTRVIADVFDTNIPTSGPKFEELSRLAATSR